MSAERNILCAEAHTCTHVVPTRNLTCDTYERGGEVLSVNTDRLTPGTPSGLGSPSTNWPQLVSQADFGPCPEPEAVSIR